jgi:hypothetical protein
MFDANFIDAQHQVGLFPPATEKLDQLVRRTARGLSSRIDHKSNSHNSKSQQGTQDSHSHAVPYGHSGGADRDRTGGLLVANQALSQLSYSPIPGVRGQGLGVRKLIPSTWSLTSDFLVGLGRVELPTSPLSGVRSSHLSYRPGRP